MGKAREETWYIQNKDQETQEVELGSRTLVDVVISYFSNNKIMTTFGTQTKGSFLCHQDQKY